MATRVYGASADLVEFEGDVHGEVNNYGTDEDAQGVLLIFSDGTILEAKYGKMGQAIWGIALRKQGALFDRIEPCMDDEASPHSDVAHFKDGLQWAYAAADWEKVQ